MKSFARITLVSSLAFAAAELYKAGAAIPSSSALVRRPPPHVGDISGSSLKMELQNE